MEIGIINENLRQAPQHIDLTRGTWKDVLGKRALWFYRQRRAGRSEAAINKEINSRYMQDKKASPWDFVKIEYHPPTKLSDFKAAQAARAKRRANKIYKEKVSKRR